MRHERTAWPEARVEKLRELLGRGLSYSGAAKVLNCSRVAVASAVRRHIHCVPDERIDRRPLKPRKRFAQQGRYTETSLTETWAERKARLAAERHA